MEEIPGIQASLPMACFWLGQSSMIQAIFLENCLNTSGPHGASSTWAKKSRMSQRILHETDSGRLFNEEGCGVISCHIGARSQRMDFNLDEEDREEKLSSYFRTHQAKDYLRIVQGLHSK